MIGRRTAVGLSLLCALLFSAVAVQSASAAKAINTTAVTCVKGGVGLDFEDEHCDKKVLGGTGKYSHVTIPADGTTTEIEVDNKTTAGGVDSAVLKGKAFGAASEITCTEVSSEKGVLHNVEHKETKQHTVTGTIVVLYKGCSVQKPLKCDVKEPIEVKTEFEGVEGLGPEKNTMGVEFKGKEGKPFAEITYINNGAESCALNGKTVNVTGSAIGTGTPVPSEKHSGSTINFDHTKITAEKTLLLGGETAGFDNTGTVRMKGGDGIALTTTT